MKLSAIVRKAAAPCLLMAVNAAGAAVLTVSASSAYAPAPQPACPSGPGCQHQAGLPVASALGRIAGQETAALPANGAGGALPSFPASHTVDDVLPSQDDSQSMASADVPTYVVEAADEFAAEQDLKWKVKLKLLQTYTGMRSLLSLADVDEGNARDARTPMSGQYREAGAAASNAARYAPETIAMDASTLCVAPDGSYNTIGVSTQRDCPNGSIFVNTRRSASMAEYAAYSQSLSDFKKGAAPQHARYTADLHHTRYEPASSPFRRCDECDGNQAAAVEASLPLRILRWMKEEPSAILLLALVMGASLVADAVAKARR